MDAMEMEIGLYDWSRLPCLNCKSAEHVPEALLRLARARTREEAEREQGIEGHVIQEYWAQATVVPVARVLMAGLAGRSLSVEARRQFLDLLGSFVNLDDDELAEQCKDVVRAGTWLLYEEVLSGRSIDGALFAYWLLGEVETNPAWLERLLEVARHLLPEDLS
ncbi:hypothetical protein [Streptomyces sp. x-80]|uniref:hypothetical protein n=1 Tax=Streptomyces sp. x-80 TaxID=2789282 RepID=UPI00398173CD